MLCSIGSTVASSAKRCGYVAGSQLRLSSWQPIVACWICEGRLEVECQVVRHRPDLSGAGSQYQSISRPQLEVHVRPPGKGCLLQGVSDLGDMSEDRYYYQTKKPTERAGRTQPH
jgi:hypothetical protein